MTGTRENPARRWSRLQGVDLLAAALGHPSYAGRVALVSSFGTESAVLLHMVAALEPATPVLFIDTLKHFPQTLAHRDLLVRRLGLRDVRSVRPAEAVLARVDSAGLLHREDADWCCHLRKSEPLGQALESFAAWITGRKRFQGGLRTDLATAELEASSGRLKLNPLAGWSEQEVEGYRVRHDLPAHPLQARGYRSVGCMPCTRAVGAGEASRAGRWPGIDKTECGIHLPGAPS
ncbi:phosphoadenylyl-sulfate reductase [Marinimicrococcus flavescens]|uniref:Adenosine 5'-phosphosulfate reductase n=1 Tax=Marinimicrococcus flavescens TaxID=3031815 RepID=A0AAP4D5X9_9PROT|nr:phosphoadenylyl-sulfate reductase [Marinimicrococcus flavescens]